LIDAPVSVQPIAFQVYYEHSQEQEHKIPWKELLRACYTG